MITFFKKISNLKTDLSGLVEIGQIADYNVTLRTSGVATIRVIAEEGSTFNPDNFATEKKYPEGFEFEVLTREEVAEDDYLAGLFAEKGDINLRDSRKRLGHMLNVSAGDDYVPPCPIVTFYSYKGGMGRSTTLAAFATYCAAIRLENGREKKPLKTVIIDCDFEAPGFTNYFLEVPYATNHRNGVIEYLSDKAFGMNIDLRKYVWEVSKEYAGEGEIYVMPAGNLDTEQEDGDFLGNSLNHYLEGLARLDISSPQYIVNQFRGLVADIFEELNPDIILIDSRTGFNDIFGITAFGLSKLVVGFFGNNVQSHPGLYLFLSLIAQMKNGSGLVVNSIVPEANQRKWFGEFQEQVKQISKQLSTGDELLDIPSFLVRRNDTLAVIGTSSEDKLDFIDLVHQRTFPDYNKMFDKIHDLALDTLALAKSEQETETSQADYEESTAESGELTGQNPTLKLKEEVLGSLKASLPDLYAENINMEEEFKNHRFFFRVCMEDIFNLDKILIIGSKGTGKTYLYKALKEPDIVQELQKRANKIAGRYEFMHLIDSQADKFIDTELLTGAEGAFETDKFYHRFWIVYIWNAVMLESESRLGYKSHLAPIKSIRSDTTTETFFKNSIQDDNKIIAIEEDLYALDQFLKTNGQSKNLIVIFDQLDEIVKPHKWSQRVAPLINFWKRLPYSKIHPKIFVRRDLFRKLGNITNSNELENKAIDIEWSQEELFAYFFKLLFSTSREKFLQIMKLYGDTPHEVFKQIERKSQAQIPLEAGLLKPCVWAFFGKYAGRNNQTHFGESYDWVYKNLKNADDTISLRPFVDWLKFAVGEAINDAERNKKEKPVLDQQYYSSEKVRQKASQRYFEELAKDKGNADLKLVFEFISRNTKYRYQEFNQEDFVNLMRAILAEYSSEIKNKSVESLTELLIVNGIIKEEHHSRGVSSNTPFQCSTNITWR
jgi:MinD-like ATPase involved in chromosome partitioning or flagellar assembly